MATIIHRKLDHTKQALISFSEFNCIHIKEDSTTTTTGDGNLPQSTNQSETAARGSKNDYVKSPSQHIDCGRNKHAQQSQNSGKYRDSPNWERQFKSSFWTIGPTQPEGCPKERRQVFGTQSNWPGSVQFACGLERTSKVWRLWLVSLRNRRMNHPLPFLLQ